MSVIVPGELDHGRAAGEAAGQPDRAHRRLGAAGDQPDLLDGGDPGHDLLGEQHLVLGGGAEGEPARGGPGDGVQHVGVGVAEDHRTPRADQVDVLGAVGVVQVRAAPPGHEPGRPPDRAEGPHRGVHPTGGHCERTLEQSLGRRRLGGTGCRAGNGLRHPDSVASLSEPDHPGHPTTPTHPPLPGAPPPPRPAVTRPAPLRRDLFAATSLPRRHFAPNSWALSAVAPTGGWRDRHTELHHNTLSGRSRQSGAYARPG